jgi:hypothetical protein
MALSEAFSAVERIDPYNHIILVELVWEFKLCLCILRGLHTVDLLHFL